jgi:hypothetical protein
MAVSVTVLAYDSAGLMVVNSTALMHGCLLRLTCPKACCVANAYVKSLSTSRYGRQREVADWDMWDTDAVDVDQADGVN